VNTLMNFEISHAVDDSDVAFAMRLDRRSTVCSMLGTSNTKLHKVGTNIDAFINLATLNYLLAGLQLCYVHSHTEKSKWFDLLYDLDQYTYASIGTQLTLWDLRYITRELIVPFGIVRGSEKQGGQDETGLSPATWPVNFVCNMVLDGHDRNVVNYWHNHDISAGDDLVFRLKPMPIPMGKNAYTLNHYYKHFVQHNFESYFQQTLGHPRATHVWQMVPDILTMDYKPENDAAHGEMGVRMSPGFEVPLDYVWQEQGFWHIARSQVMVRRHALKEYYNDDMANQLKISHLDLTFEPTYTKFPGESRDLASLRTVRKDMRPPDLVAPDRMNDFRNPVNRGFVLPGMMARADWAPQLRLEELLGGSMPLLPEQEAALRSQAQASSELAFGADLLAACQESRPAKRRAVSLAGRGDMSLASHAVMGPPAPRPLLSSHVPRPPLSSHVHFDLSPHERTLPPLEPASDVPASDPPAESLDYGLVFSDPDPESARPVEVSSAPDQSSAASASASSSVKASASASSSVKALSSILASVGGGRGAKKKRPLSEEPGAPGPDPI